MLPKAACEIARMVGMDDIVSLKLVCSSVHPKAAHLTEHEMAEQSCDGSREAFSYPESQ
jgi:hypothetical protein